MKRRVISLALALVLLVGVLVLPAQAANKAPVFSYLEELAKQGTYNSSNGLYYTSFYLDEGETTLFVLFYEPGNDYLEADIAVLGDIVVGTALFLKSDLSKPYDVESYYGESVDAWLKLSPAGYTGQALSFSEYEGDNSLKSQLNDFTNQALPLILEVLRSLIYEGGYDLDSLGFNAFTRHTYHFFTDDPVVTKAPTCNEGGILTYKCAYKNCTATYDVPSEPDPSLHHWKLQEVVEPPEGDFHGTAVFVCSVCGAVKGGEYCAGSIFTDMPEFGHFAHKPIDWAYFNGVTTGASATTFEPNSTCTRAQIVTFLWRAMGKPKPTTTDNPFTDVTKDDYFYKAVLWAVEKGITKGSSKTTFSPYADCTRGECVTFLWRALGKPDSASADNPFTDVPEEEFYTKAVLWAVGSKVTKGSSKTTFSPYNSCTRAEIVTFLYRALIENAAG